MWGTEPPAKMGDPHHYHVQPGSGVAGAETEMPEDNQMPLGCPHWHHGECTRIDRESGRRIVDAVAGTIERENVQIVGSAFPDVYTGTHGGFSTRGGFS